MTNRPEPLVPAQVDLRDFQFMPMDVRRLLTSETWVLGDGEEKAAAVTLWLESWHQVPAGSLPSSDRMLAHLSQSKKWAKVKEHALRGWVLCSDDRRYHAVVCEKVLEAWIEKLAASLSGAAGNAKRWGVDVDLTGIRAQFIQAVELLRQLAPQSRSLKKKVVAVILAGSGPESPPDAAKGSPPESPPDRKGQGQGQGIEEKEKPPRTATTGEGGDLAGHEPTQAGLVCRALRRAGIGDVNPGHPTLQALLDAGATEAEFLGAVDAATGKEKPFAYVLGVVEGQRKRAAEMAKGLHRGPMPAAPADDRKARQLATAGLMTGAVRAQPQQEFVDVDARVIPPRKLG